jgi:SAM-dependent methyltransferase
MSLTLPSYQPLLKHYHAGWRDHLRRILGLLPLNPGDNALDVASGDGFYTRLLAERVGRKGRVTGVDASPDYLALSRAKTKKHPCAIDWTRGDVSRLPFPDGEFDLVWCAQSLQSLPNPAAAMEEMARVARPGGVVAVFENDTLHQFILPWPPETELGFRAAEMAALSRENRGRAGKFYVGRFLRRLFDEAGLRADRLRAVSTSRQAPLARDERRFFVEYLRNLRGRIEPRLKGRLKKECKRLLDPRSARYLLKDPDFSATSVDHLQWGAKPRRSRPRRRRREITGVR